MDVTAVGDETISIVSGGLVSAEGYESIDFNNPTKLEPIGEDQE
jgi:hypothetical protein